MSEARKKITKKATTGKTPRKTAARQSGQADETKEIVISFRCLPEERQALEDAAARHDTSLSNLIRKRALSDEPVYDKKDLPTLMAETEARLRDELTRTLAGGLGALLDGKIERTAAKVDRLTRRFDEMDESINSTLLTVARVLEDLAGDR